MFASCDNTSNSNDDSSNQTSTDNSNSSGNSGSSNSSNSGGNSGSNGNSSSGNSSNPGGNSSDNESPSQVLPDNVGENPIKETITLIDEKWADYYLKLSPDGTALYLHDDDTEKELNYTYNADKEEIQMQVKKIAFYGLLGDQGLMTYNEIISQVNNGVEKFRENLKEMYEENRGKEWFKDEYPDCDSYDDFEQAYIKGFDSVEDALEYWTQIIKVDYKAAFGALATYSYEIDDDGEMTLTEKFTGVKNMLDSSCEYHYKDSTSRIDIRIYNSIAIFEDHDNDEYFDGILDTDNKKITFKSEDDGTQVNATYTEDISKETVTLKFNGKEYVCKFEGVNFHEK